MRTLLTVMAIVLVAVPAMGGLVDTRYDTSLVGATVDYVISANEYGPGNAYSYLGAGTGFGGTVGNGTLYMKSDASNLYIGFNAGSALNDLVTIMLDTKTGGYTDAQMSDQGDGGRRAVSEQSVNADDAYDAGFLPDFGVVFASWGTVMFETAPWVNGPPDNGSLIFKDFNGNGSLPREYAIPLSTLGVGPGGNVDFFVAYVADSGYGSNESIPAFDPLQTFGNPGFGTTSPGYGNFDRFVVVPEPGSLLALVASLVGFGGVLRRKS